MKRSTRSVGLGSVACLSHPCVNFHPNQTPPRCSQAKNLYPGVQCDVYSAVYQFTWAPNPHWSKIYAEGAEILAYIERTVVDFDLAKHFRLSHKVVGARFNETAGKWTVEVEGPSGHKFEDEAEVLVSAMGCLNLWKW